MRSIYLLLAVAMFVVAPLVGCSDPAENPTGMSNSQRFSSAVDYGNGVYYFGAVSRDFGNQLSAFVEAHPELEIVAITGSGIGAYGTDRGYFVVFRRTPSPS